MARLPDDYPQMQAIRPGQVVVEQGRNGWLYVQIGRHGRIKRFNLSNDEAAQLVQQIAALAGSVDAG